jgi:hypothetical protein
VTTAVTDRLGVRDLRTVGAVGQVLREKAALPVAT